MKATVEIYRRAAMAAFNISTRHHNRFVAESQNGITAEAREDDRIATVASQLGNRLYDEARALGRKGLMTVANA